MMRRVVLVPTAVVIIIVLFFLLSGRPPPGVHQGTSEEEVPTNPRREVTNTSPSAGAREGQTLEESTQALRKDVASRVNLEDLYFIWNAHDELANEEAFELLRNKVSTKPLLNGKDLSQVRLALVKQDVYTNLYCSPSSSDGAAVVSRTLKHQGPVGLFTGLLNTQFIMLTTRFDDPETEVWKEKNRDCGWMKHLSVEDSYYHRFNFTSVVDRNLLCNQSQFSVDEKKVDWNSFDIVISLDQTVGARLTRQFPSVVWAYFITEGCMETSKQSMKAPLPGYDFYLTQNYNMRSPGALPPHVIEFPFTFSHAGVFHRLYGQDLEQGDTQRRGMILCRGHVLTKEQIQELELITGAPVEETGGTPSTWIKRLMKAKYYVSIRQPGFNARGNAVAEALMCGALSVGGNLLNREILALSQTYAPSFEKLRELFLRLESRPEEYAQTLKKQRQLYDFLSFDRPLYQLLEKSQKVLQSRNKDALVVE